MAVAYTSTASTSLGGTAGGAGLVQKAYDLLFEKQLRAATLLSALADKHPTNQTNPGSVVVLQTLVDLAAADTPLSELVDPDSVSLATPVTATITLQEYGLSTQKTRALDLFSLKNLDPDIVNIITQNSIDSIESVAMTALRAGTNVLYAGATATSTATVTAAATFTSANVRKVVATMEDLKAMYREGDYFWGGISPRVAHDLRTESGALGWLIPNAYGEDQSNIWNGSLGLYEGVRWVKSPRVYSALDGAASARVYRTFIAGRQAFASAFAVDPHIVLGNVVDRLMRFRPIGWHAVGGYTIFRQDCLYRIESGSSIAAP